MSVRKPLLVLFMAALVSVSLVGAIDLSAYWVDSDGANWENAVAAGTDSDGAALYVIRALNKDQSSLVPGKYNPLTDTAYVCYGGAEVVVNNFEVLVLPPKIAKRCQWVHASDTSDGDAVVGGYDSDGSDLFVIAADYKSAQMVPGKYNPNHDKAYIPYGGKEIAVKDFYFLVAK